MQTILVKTHRRQIAAKESVKIILRCSHDIKCFRLHFLVPALMNGGHSLPCRLFFLLAVQNQRAFYTYEAQV